MDYVPHPDEISAVPNLSDDELLEYFLYRIFETDEVWFLKEDGQPVLRNIAGQDTLPVWTHKFFAEAAAIDDWANMKPIPETVEYFAYQIINLAANQGITLEIMPRNSLPGCLVNPQRLFRTIENMMEARDSMVGDD